MMAALLAALAAAGAVLDPGARYPEGPLFHEGRLFVAEMGADTVYRHDGARKQPFFTQHGCGPTAIAPYGEGFAVLCHLDRSVMLVDGQGRPQRRLQTDSAGAAFDDPNDAAADDRGGVYFSDPGVFDADAPATGEVFRLDAQGGVRRVAAGLRYPNGVFFDAARQRLLVSEHLARRVLAYPVQADGTLGEGQVLAVMPPPAKQAAYREAGPDGLEIGPDGALYVALYGEGRVLRLSPEGRLMGEIATPFAFVTNLAFDAASGRGVVVGAYVNDRAPFPGAVAALPELK